STTCHKMLHVLDGKMLQKQMKVGEQHVLKQPNLSQNCVNIQFLHMRFLHNICAIQGIHPDTLSTCANSVTCERLWSMFGMILTKFHNGLGLSTLTLCSEL